jgi:hypothetical protein
MNENFDVIELKIITELNDFFKEAEEKQYMCDRIWTNRLKGKIAELGESLGYKVAVGGFKEKFELEWLYDIVWYVEDSEGRLVSIPLIVESEWDKNYAGIKYDFEKLLVGNAERRLMICQSRKEQIDSLIDKFKIAINTFQENYGDRFMFAILNQDTERDFIFKVYEKTNQSQI